LSRHVMAPPAPRLGASYAFEDSRLDARRATVFWRSAVCPSVLPVIASPLAVRNFVAPLPLAGLDCQVTVLAGDDERHHMLFAQDGRCLQLEIRGPMDISALRLMTAALPPVTQMSAHLRSLKRLADLAKHRMLRKSLYEEAPRGARLRRALQALDGWLAGAAQREIAAAVFGSHRVERDWTDPRDHLRDQVRRAIHRGRALMTGGYLQLLK